MQHTGLTEAVRAELETLGAPDVEAVMADGIVTLCGQVADDRLRRRIERRLLALPEVLDVHNYLAVSPGCDGMETRLVEVLVEGGVDVRELWISIAQGAVTLSGRAASGADRDLAARLSWTLPGVREVVNRLAVSDREGGPGEGGEPIP